MVRKCTIPKIFGVRKWFEKNFGDLCHQHDEYYVKRSVTRKQADIRMYRGIVNRGHPLLGSIVYVFLRSFGWLYYYNIIK